ncbi:MAG: glycosyltransferase [Nitrososphaerota archaeon]|nr:glycosyltransferase [Nitrososphaerota archaeon]
MRDQVTIVIPTLNEEEAIGPLIDEVRAAGYCNILIVDGYSKDGTTTVVGSKGAKFVLQEGAGKAGALATAFQGVITTPYVAILDGDGSYAPSDLDRFLPLLSRFDFIKGVRNWKESMSRTHRLGNLIITSTFNLLFGTNIGDVCSGMYVIDAGLARQLDFSKHPLTVEQEILAQAVLASTRITSIPINYRKRFGGKSKTNTWRQGFRDLITNFDLARTHNPILLFSFLATLGFVPALFFLGYALFLFLAHGNFHGGYVLAGLSFLVLGAQGFTVATIAAMLRRIERRLTQRIAIG